MSSIDPLGEIVVAARNVARQRRRSAMALYAIAFGVIALMLAGGFIDWLLWAMREGAIRSQFGHIQVMRPGYRTDGAADPFRYLLPEGSTERSAIERLPELKVVGSRLGFNGLISRDDSTLAFIGEGVEPDRETLLSEEIAIAHGVPLSRDDPSGIVVGKGLAAALGVGVGDTVVLMAGTRSGGVNAVECRIRGLFVTSSKAYDDSALRTPIGIARDLLRVNGSHLWVLLLDETDKTPAVLAQLRSSFAGQELEFVPWFELADFYNKTVVLFGRQVGVMKLIIAVIIVLSISNTLTMAVMERTTEIGTAMALGRRRAAILRQFVIEGFVLGVLGGAAGVLAGFVLASAISWIGIPMPPPPGMESGYLAEIRMSWRVATEAPMLAIAASVVASAYPAWRASRLKVVDALRVGR